jgi:hypothetical protein
MDWGGKEGHCRRRVAFLLKVSVSLIGTSPDFREQTYICAISYDCIFASHSYTSSIVQPPFSVVAFLYKAETRLMDPGLS